MQVPKKEIQRPNCDESSPESAASVQVSSSSQAIFSGQIPEVPPELWAMVAALSKRNSVASLCAVSHALYALFSPLLYNMIIPSLTESQSIRLIKSFSQTHTSPFKPHTATLIRRLVFPRVCSWLHAKEDQLEPQEYHAALMNLYLAPEDGRSMCGSALRTLAWNLESGIDELAVILQKPGCFPNLKEISVRCRSDASFDFVLIPNLEKLEVTWTLGDMVDKDYNTTWPVLWSAFSAALKTIPLSSPRLLHAFKLTLFLWDWRRDQSPLDGSTWDAYAEMITTINEMRLPALTSLEFAVDTRSFAHTPSADFLPFLRGHPELTHVTLCIKDMRIPTEVEVAAYLPHLRVFTGSLLNCAAIASRARELEHLFVLFPRSDNGHDDLLSVPTIFPPNVGRTVTRLNVCEVDNYIPTRYPRQLSSQWLDRLVSAFPNITHLDVTLEGRIREYCTSFAALTRLEYLCVRAHQDVWPDDRESATKIFSAKKLAALIRDVLLPSLVRLSDVNLHLDGDRSEPATGCESCDEDDRRYGPRDFIVEYRFLVDRAGGAEPEVTLVETMSEKRLSACNGMVQHAALGRLRSASKATRVDFEPVPSRAKA
ncbi:hypothetical protein C8R44DRAFT_878616 [Mycena epipterygia]|nr:hypothetical protein C8R44DRAFT_878616 [Mycena epipterygia]